LTSGEQVLLFNKSVSKGEYMKKSILTMALLSVTAVLVMTSLATFVSPKIVNGDSNLYTLNTTPRMLLTRNIGTLFDDDIGDENFYFKQTLNTNYHATEEENYYDWNYPQFEKYILNTSDSNNPKKALEPIDMNTPLEIHYNYIYHANVENTKRQGRTVVKFEYLNPHPTGFSFSYSNLSVMNIPNLLDGCIIDATPVGYGKIFWRTARKNTDGTWQAFVQDWQYKNLYDANTLVFDYPNQTDRKVQIVVYYNIKEAKKYFFQTDWTTRIKGIYNFEVGGYTTSGGGSGGGSRQLQEM